MIEQDKKSRLAEKLEWALELYSAPLEFGLCSGDEQDSIGCIEKLGELGSASSIPILRKCAYAKKNDSVRIAVAKALRNFKEEKAVEILGDMAIHDNSEKVRETAAESLVFIGGATSKNYVVEAMKKGKINPDIGEKALRRILENFPHRIDADLDFRDKRNAVVDELVEAIKKRNATHSLKSKVRLWSIACQAKKL